MKTPQARSAPRAISDLSHGKVLEKDLSDIMNPLEKARPMLWERVIDAASANTITVGAADCDFKLTVPGDEVGHPFVFWIECKASVLSNTFSENFRSLVKDKQLPLMRKGERAGAFGIYMYRSVKLQKIEIWSLQDIAAWYYLKRQDMLSEPKFVFPNHRLKEWCHTLVNEPARILRKLQS